MKIFKESWIAVKLLLNDRRAQVVAALGALAFGYLNYWLFYQVTTFSHFWRQGIADEYGRFSVAYTITAIAATVATIALFGIGAALLDWQFRHKRQEKLGNLFAGGFGTLSGAFGAACPVCGAFLLQALGVASGISLFPLKGLEFKFLSLGLLAAGTVYSGAKSLPLLQSKCDDCRPRLAEKTGSAPAPAANFWGRNALTNFLIAVLALNHILIGQVAVGMGGNGSGSSSKSVGAFLGSLIGIKSAAAKVIIAPKLNPDGRTTSLVEQPTITEVPANPNSGDALADSKVVMLATGKPFYAPDDIDFDDPINAQNKWGAYEDGIQLTGALQTRYDQLISAMLCSYCCGSPTRATLNKQCGCAHARAVRGFYKYMLQTYGDKYSNEELIGESHRWYALWYPKGMLEDYLLATGKGDVIGHETHGGAGADGRHGL